MVAPTPTSAVSTVDYIPAGVRRFTFVPTIASVAAPTATELSAGTDYTNAIVSYAGFQTTAADVSNATYGSRFDTNVPGVTSSAQSSWVLKADKTSQDARATLTPLLNGYVVIYNEGIVTGNKYSVWPVRISSVSNDPVGRDALATITVMFSITSSPVENISVP